MSIGVKTRKRVLQKSISTNPPHSTIAICFHGLLTKGLFDDNLGVLDKKILNTLVSFLLEFLL